MKLCLIGPFPPPMNGNSKALDTLDRSYDFNKAFQCYKVNLNQTAVGQSGKFSFDKVKSTSGAVRKIKKLTQEKIDCFYLTTAQSKVGLIRDFLITKTIKKSNPKGKIIAHLHGGGFKNFYDNSSDLIRNLVVHTYSHFDKVIVLSESLIGMFDGIYPREKISVRYNCVDNEFLFDPGEIQEKINQYEKNNVINVTYISNMIESKGYHHVLEAAKKMNDDYPDVFFNFAGRFPSGEQENFFNGELDRCGLRKTVHYWGTVSGKNKKDLLRKTDIFVLPTRYPPEGQPISIIEAMGAGAVILTTDQGGIRDIVKNGINGFIMTNNFSDEIVSHIVKLKDDPDLRKKISLANNNCVHQHLTESHYVGGLIGEIESLFSV